MSYDASRISVDSMQATHGVQFVEAGATTTAVVNIHINNNGYLFSLNNADLTITVFDTLNFGDHLGVGDELITVDPGNNFTGTIRIPMITSEYQDAKNINVTVSLQGDMALKLPSSRIAFVSFTLTSSEVRSK
ncbi:MAG: hypothetical protein QF812_02965 [Nitrososphaerales archaeon]|jgi:FlaG/FlaF family flagellin (archaellin)|nr:hypothetical protein [Nitrososphaerales archaeon]